VFENATIVMVDAGFGIDACHALAKSAADAGVRRRIVLLSPYERRGFGAPAETGFDGYLIKPVRSRSLAARFNEPQDAPAGATELAAPRAARTDWAMTGLRVLIAEDNPINAMLACALIEKMGGEAVWVKEGAAAVRAVAESRALPFAIALFDVRMPGMNGLEAIAAVRRLEAESALGHLPVIALTANASADDRRECLAAGFDDFVAKPLEREAFVAALRTHLRKPPVAA
jgi:CheY-like chemotaxis protein